MKIFGFDYSQEGFYYYIMKHLYGQQRLISGEQGIFHSPAPEAYGANAFYNSMQHYDEGAHIKFLNKDSSGNYDLGGAMGFAGAKLNHIDNLENPDGKVSLAEYAWTLPQGINKQAMVEGLDVNEDGFISTGEEAALSLLTDYLDGSSDGVMTKQGRINAFYQINYSPENFAQSIRHIYNNHTKQMEQNFEMPWNEIDGNEGPYNSNTTVGRGANVGAKIFDLHLKGKNDELAYSNYQYMQRDGNGNFDLDSGLAANTYIKGVYDKNRDGKVTSWEVPGGLFDVTDVNGDGELSAGEHLARTMVADTNNDGKITHEEKRDFQLRLKDLTVSKKQALFNEIKEVYTTNSIGQKESSFEMPEKTGSGYPPSYGNPYGYQKYIDFYSHFLSFLNNLSGRFRL